MQMNEFLKTMKSTNTAERYGVAIKQFLAFHKLTQKKALSMTVDEANDAMEAFKDHLEQEGKSGQTIHISWFGVKKFFAKNKIKITVKCDGLDKSKTFFDYIPSKADIKLLRGKARLDYKVAICLQAFSGMRPVDVRHLKYQYIRESYERGDDVLTIEFKDVKRKNWYFTFLGPEGLFFLRELIEKRKSAGEVFVDDTYILKWLKDEDRTKEPRNRKSYGYVLSDLIKKTVGKHPTGVKHRFFRSYGLRKYFRKWARVFDKDEAEFMMAHKAGGRNLSRTYSGIEDHDPEVINELKAKYIKYLPDLETEISDTTIKTELEQLKEKLQSYENENLKLEKKVSKLKSQQQPETGRLEALEKQMAEMSALFQSARKDGRAVHPSHGEAVMEKAEEE